MTVDGGSESGASPRPAAAGQRSLIYRFGNCVLDARTLELSVAGQPVKLEPKPLDLLVFLLRHAGEVVTKDELQDGVWPGRILSESVLTKSMARLRQALGDDAQSLIKTVHGYGYRLVASVQIEAAGAIAPRAITGLAAGESPPQRALWQLVQQIGSGGYGEVWLAEHRKTHERRVFKFALDADSLGSLKREITLFRVLSKTCGEQGAFVRLLDWNLEEPPYFIETEHVADGALPQWADAQGGLATLPLAQRLELLAQAADALASAHAAGVLHKDLKPSNLLIARDAAGAPRVLLADFGSGHVTDPERLAALEITRLGFTETGKAGADGSGGTPLYFAPERVLGQPPTALTDIYALGVILYQVLVGDLRRPLAPGWEQDIADPSLREDIAAAAAGQAAVRLGDAAELSRRLRTLDARREQRQQQAAAAAESQRLRTTLERTRLRRAWALATSAVLAIALGITGYLLLQVRTARDALAHESNTARQVTAFLTEDLFGQADPYVGRDAGISARELLDRAARVPDVRFIDSPETLGAVKSSLAAAYAGLGDHVAAEREARSALRTFEPLPGTHAQQQTARGLVRDALLAQDHWAEARIEVEAMLAAERARSTPDRTVVLEARGWLARIDHLEGRLAEASAALAALENEASQTLGPDHAVTLHLVRLAANVDLDLGEEQRAEARYRRYVEGITRLHGRDHPATVEARIDLGRALARLKRLDEADTELRASVELAREQLGPEHPQTQRALNELGTNLQQQKRVSEAEAVFRAVLEIRERAYGEQAMVTRDSLNNLAMLLGANDRDAEAVPLLERALASERKALGERHPQTLILSHNLAMSLRDMGALERSIALQRENLALASEVLPPEHWQTAIYMATLGQTLTRMGRLQEAGPLLQTALDHFTRQFGDSDGRTRRARQLLSEWESAQTAAGAVVSNAKLAPAVTKP